VSNEHGAGSNEPTPAGSIFAHSSSLIAKPVAHLQIAYIRNSMVDCRNNLSLMFVSLVLRAGDIFPTHKQLQLSQRFAIVGMFPSDHYFPKALIGFKETL